CRPTRDEQYDVVLVRCSVSRGGIRPRAPACELAVLRPLAERQRERADLVTRHRGVHGELQTCDLLLHEPFIVVLRQRRVPQRVVAQLEARIREELHLAMPPLRLLPFYTLVAEEGAPRLRSRQHAEHRLVLPPVM